MKKYIYIILLSGMLFFMTACGNETAVADYTQNEFSEFKVNYSGLDITPGIKFDYENIVGKEPKISTVAGCALYGFDHVYTYDDIEIVANINEEENYELIYSVYFLNENVSTPEGIHIGSTVSELIDTYGENYDEFNGVYTYNGVGLYMQVQTKDNIITSIEYIMVTN